MKKIVVASQNPVKMDAVLNGFNRLFPGQIFNIEAVDVPSGVADQPMSDHECLQGANNRVKNARSTVPLAAFWVGVEGGCDYLEGELVAFAWVVIDDGDRVGSARTALFRLPDQVQKLVESGLELGEADDQVFSRTNSKQESGAVGLLTDDVVTRTTLYEQAIILALIPFKNPDLYQDPLA
jgi:inosine/xanthosine triphosphatase